MIAAIIIYILIVTLPLIAAAALTERICRLWSWPVRGAWAVTAFLIVLIGGRTVAQQVIPRAVSNPASITAVQSLRPSAATPTGSIESAVAALISLPRTVARYAAHRIPPAQDRMLTILWCLMSAVVLALICCVYIRVAYARRRWSVIDFAGHRVRVAPYAGPAIVGLFRPEIVVPRSMLECPAQDRELIVMHETEHRNARDPLLLAAMWGLVALVPWHPGAWYCLARTRLAIELDCDARVVARVVARGATVRSYAQLLVNQARAHLGAPLHVWLGATSLLEPSSHLERRLDAMVPSNNSALARRPVARLLRTLSYLAIVSTITIAACESHVPTAADISGLDAASAEQNARSASLLDGQPVTYYVDDIKVSADSAHAITAADISAITVVKRGPRLPGEVRMVTMPHPLLHQVDQADSLAARNRSGKTFTVHFRKGRLPASQAQQSATADRRGEPFSGAVVIDGVASDLTAMKSIDPNQIASVEVVKGPAALEQSTDPRAKNGLIRITLKH